jgi:hypothetical protein
MPTQTVILAGTPGAVSGFLPFHNRTDGPVPITEVTVGDIDTDATMIVPVEHTVVAPGRRVRIPLELTLPPQTTPDAYPLIVTVADTTVEATAYVAESHVLALSPATLIVENRPDTKSSRTLVVANEGNVAMRVPDLDRLPLYREDTALVTLRALADPTLVTPDTRLPPLPEPVGELRVTTRGVGQPIAPGDARAIELVVGVPQGLPQPHRFLAALPLSVATVLVTVVPGGTALER